MTKLKAVLDTNVYRSGIIFGGNNRHILDLAIKGKITVIISPAILLEISEKLKNKFHWSENQVVITLRTIAKTVTVVYPRIKLSVVKSDKDDNKIIEAAVESGTSYDISGDKHLLDIKKFQSVRMVTPAQFLSVYLKD